MVFSLDIPPFVRLEQVIHADNGQNRSATRGLEDSERLGYSVTLKSVFLSCSSASGSLDLSKGAEVYTPELSSGCPPAILDTQTPLPGAAVLPSRCTLSGAG